jgi:hypothetical protein
MTTRKPRRGTGFFQWNTGAWFGSQIGCTAWMLAAGLESVGRGALLPALLFLGCFAVTTALCTRLWWRRETVAPFPAIMCMIFVGGLGGALALAIVSRLEPEEITTLAEVSTLVMMEVILATYFSAMEWTHRRRGTRTKDRKPREAVASGQGGLWDRELDPS